VSPSEEYAQRLKDRQARVAGHQRRHVLIGNLRLAIFVSAVFLAWLAFVRHALSPWWLCTPLIAFLLLAAYHSHVLRSKTCAERSVAVYENGLARIEDRWAGIGETGDRFNDPHHVYAADLDLFGRGGVFQLLSTARTRMGENTLAAWLLSPARVEDVRQRQAAVADLRDRLDLREDLAVLGEDAGVGVHPDALLKWAGASNELPAGWLRPASFFLASCAIATAVLWAVWDRALPFLIVVAIEAALSYALHHQLDRILHTTEHAFENLGLLAAVLARLERETFAAPRLREIAEHLSSHHIAGSRAINRLRKIVDLSMSRDNLFVRLIDVPLLYSVQVAISAEHWRQIHGSAVHRWLDSVGEMEALLSLSAYCYEHPSDTFPEFLEGPASLEAEQVGHPLLPSTTCVRNDVRICAPTRALLVSGSNMSGKSTLLRAVGINTVLAMAGAPVPARRMRLTALQVGASIRVNDSLQEGSSRFYAEITRLRQIFDFAGLEPHLLFLLDELLQGTNSKDRQIGAAGVLRALLERGAIGMVTTHDLALTEIGENLGSRVRNVHFQDDLEQGRIHFDYHLREGVVTKSNGLALMRSIGLDV
jgi:hypothetical protein